MRSVHCGWSELKWLSILHELWELLGSPLAILCSVSKFQAQQSVQSGNLENPQEDFQRIFCSSFLPSGLMHKFQPLKLPSILISVSSTQQTHSIWFEFSLLVPSENCPKAEVGESIRLAGFVSFSHRSCTACCALSENNCFMYFVQFSSSLQQEGKFSTSYSIIAKRSNYPIFKVLFFQRTSKQYEENPFGEN